MKILGNVNWLRKQAADSEPKLLHLEQGHIEQTQSATNATLIIRNIQYQDNGIYFCQQECPEGSPERGCGTELRVMAYQQRGGHIVEVAVALEHPASPPLSHPCPGFSTLAQLKRRNTLKDSIILIQTLLIIVFIIVPIFLLLDKDDHKAGMEEDHTYEGLNIDQTATYEDIVTLRTGEVKWSVGEHPGQE
ncbi:B-cell antigen receptor complex-associated protein beta chain [Pteropus alecto]|uniref:B-cell antigen receptor complex-associated protein beta chain n=1 Tax=Pteropus alecto TaxID=9402 RepID=L5KME4_PTEAL|nr:B-cell antigen receptor complex-associated protein beta chain [Pteropus alecto]